MILNGRLKRLEKIALGEYRTTSAKIRAEALHAVSNEDLDRLEEFFKRGVPFSQGTPEERSAVRRYEALLDAASRRIMGRPFRFDR
jgi:hypothetical protein